MEDAVVSRRALAALLAVAAFVVGLAQESPSDYPQWRGVSRDGSASAFVSPPTWPDALTKRWRVEVGEGYASPLVIGTNVYVFSRRNGRETLSALDADSGKEIWQTGYDAPYSPSAPSAVHGSGPKATPLYQDGRIITLGISGIVAGFSARDGALLWRTPQPAEAPFFSAASSPVGDGRLAILHPGNYEPLTAFDASGKIAWTAGGGGFFMAPNITTIDGVRQVVSVTQQAVIGVSPADGRVLWQFPWGGGGSGGIMPIVHAGTIIVSANAAGVVAIKPGQQNGSWVANKLWESPAVEMYISHPVIVGDVLYGFSRRGSGQLFALDVRDGRVLWLGEPRYASNVAFAKSGDLIFLMKDDGALVVARANPAGLQPLKTYQVADSATWAQPVLSRKRLFVKDVSHLTLWTVD